MRYELNKLNGYHAPTFILEEFKLAEPKLEYLRASQDKYAADNTQETS